MHGRRHHRARGRGRCGRRFPNAEELLRRLEEYQRDLEQEVADVADLIRRLKQGEPAQAGTV
jgi:ADP-dependent phosphofructokinase/glucokinase